MKSCGLALAIDGTQDDLLTQMLNLNDKNLPENPFEILEEDMAAAAPSFNVTEEDKDDDIELDIM